MRHYIGTRIGRLVGEKPDIYTNKDRYFYGSLDSTFDKGLTRDEISVREGSGLFEKLSVAARTSNRHVARYVADIESLVNGMRDSILECALQ